MSTRRSLIPRFVSETLGRHSLVLTLLIASSACGGQNSVSAQGTASTSTGPVVKSLASRSLQGCILSDFYASVKIGSADFNLIVDSGSSTTAVAAADCSTCGVSPTYSETGVKQSGSASAAYGDDSGWSGTIWQDSMTVMAGETALTPAVNVNFAAMDSEEGSTKFFSATMCNAQSQIEYQGILGLGPNDLLQKGTQSLMSAIATSGKLSHDAFAVQLCDVGGEIWFGGYDESAVTAQPFFAPLVTTQTETQAEYYYAVDLTTMAVGSSDSGLTSKEMGAIIVDTGTSGLALSAAGFNALNQLLKKNSAFVKNFGTNFLSSGKAAYSSQNLTPAQVDAALPTLTLGIQGTDGIGKLTLKATESYMMATTLSSGETLYVPLAFATSSGTPPILGGAAMRSHVVIFDRENNQIGFAPQTGCSDTLPVLAVD